MNKSYLFSFLLIFISICPYLAQDEPVFEKCGSIHMHNEKMNDPVYEAEFTSKVAKAKKHIADNSVNGKMPPCDNTLLIPVAVHYQDMDMTAFDAACAEQMALDQIERMNLDFAGTNADIGEWANAQASGFYNGINNKESCIQFCLPTLNHPAGFGLNNGDYAITINQTTGDNDAAWTGYLNFWVRDLGGGLLGYSPLGGNMNGDGVVCEITAFGSTSCGGITISGTYGLGRTMTHEIGHYLLLSHPFDSGNCVADGDNITDTPFTDNATFGCATFGDVNCTDPILWMSYMDYGDDVCLYMFSEGQVDVMEGYASTSLQTQIDGAVDKCTEAACAQFAAGSDFENETCSGFDGSITMTVSNENPPVGYSINGGITFQNNPIYNNLVQGDYSLMIVDDEGCEYTEDITLIREQADMNVQSVVNSFCGDSEGSITVNVNESTTFTYSLDGVNFQPEPTFENLNYGDYVVTAINNVGCIGQLDVEVEDDNNLDVIVDERKNINCFYFDNGSIEFHVLGATPPVSYAIDGSIETTSIPKFEALSEGLHTIHIVDSIGCQEYLDFEIARSYSSIDEDCPCVVYVPNAMTPDEDGVNDLFKVVPSCPITNFSIEIFDRWGALIFQSNDVNISWNAAERNGEYYAVDGMYFYKINYSWGSDFESTVNEVQTGNILVLR